MANIKTRIILRNDTTENWNANDSVVLMRGEVGIEFLSNGGAKIKIGDGSTTWAKLKTIADGQFDYSQLEEIVNNYLEENPIAIETDKTLSQAGQAADAAAIRNNCLFNNDCLVLHAGDADDNTFM